MTASTDKHLRLRDPGELIAAVPSLIGFTPRDSLVVISNRAGPTFEVGLVMRADLLPAECHRELARSLVPPLREQRAVAAALVFVGGEDHREHRAQVGVLRETFEAAGIDVPYAFWTPEIRVGGPWWCVDDGCEGTVPDPMASPVAAMTAAAGSVLYRSREELEAVIAPEPAAVLCRRAKLIAARRPARDAQGAADALRRIDSAAGAVFADQDALTDTDVVELALAIRQTGVRDAVLIGRTAQDDLALRRLWLQLTRALPEPECADAACLLGVSAYVTGEGALAGIALDRAQQVDPEHRLTALLSAALRSGVAPPKLRAMLADLVANARAAITCSEDEAS